MSRSSSAVVDSKVVEMTLENSNFEQNATKSISTLQKLKEALNFTTSKDGLDKFNGSLKKVDFNPLNAGINSAKEGMSALDQISFGFFTKIGSRIEETAHKYMQMFSSIKSATDGFAEYELKMGSVQTILMSAKTKEGLPVTLDMVNQKLDELNTYADKTIYSFSDMTSSIGKFTNAGVDLDTAVAAIQGISNEAAISGANAQQASHAMYNFAQALSSGYVKLIDWKSIENANMATVDFKQTLIDTALELGTVTKEGDKFKSTTTDMNGKISEAFNATLGFNDSLSAQWMTTDVLTTALGKYADETTEIGKKAFQAATEVKTFSQLLDTLQEAAGSGWAQTWELIVGDYEQSKSLFTMLSNTFGGIIDASAKSRNALLEEGLGGSGKGAEVTKEYLNNLGLSSKQLKALSGELLELGKANGVAFESDDVVGLIKSLDEGWLSVDKLKTVMQELNGVGTEGPDGMTKSLDEMKEAALRVIRGGDSGYSSDMAERFKQLTEDGFDPEKIQAYVNEIHKLTGGTWEVTDAIMAEAAANVGLNEEAGKTPGLFDDILDKVTVAGGKKTGRELLFDALKTSLFAFKTILGTIKSAWQEVFPPATADTVYKIAEGINKASKALRRFALKNAENIRSVFVAIFDILDLILRVGKTVITSVFGGLKKAFSGGNGQAGAFIKKIADLIDKFHDWVIENEIIEKAVNGIGSAIMTVIGVIQSWIDKIGKIPQVQNIINSFKETFGWIGTNAGPIFEKAGKKISTFRNKLKDAFTKSANPKEFFTKIRDAFTGLWTDITSSETFEKIKESFDVLGQNIKSFINDLGTNEDGTRNTFGKILDAVINFRDKIKQVLSGVDENGEKIDIFKGIKDAFTGLWDDLTASGIGEKIKSAFDTVKQAIDDFFTSLGTNDDGSLNAFGHIWEGIKTALSWIIEKAGAAKTAITDFFNTYHLGEFFSGVWDDIYKGFGDFFTNLPQTISNVKGKFGEFINKVKDLGGIKFSNLGEIWAAFKDTVGQYFKDNDVFKPISDAFGKIKDKIVAKLEEIGVPVIAIRNKIVGFFTSIKDAIKDFSLPDAFQSLIDFFIGKKDDIADGADTVGEGVGGFFERIKKWIGGNDIASVITKIVGAFMLFKGAKFLISLVKPIEQLISAMADEKKAKAKMMNKAALLETAAAVAIFAFIVYQLGQMKVGDMVQGVIALGLMAAIIAAFSVVVSKFGSGGDMAAAGAMALELAVAVGILTYVVHKLGELITENPGKMVAGAIGLVVLLGILVGVSALLNRMNGFSNALTGGAMLATVGSLLALIFAIKLVTDMPLTQIASGLVKVVAIGAALALVMFMMKKAVGEGLTVAIGIAGLAACIIAIGAALWIISKIDPERLLPSCLALMGVMVVLALVFNFIGSMQTGFGAMIGLAAVILVLAGAIAVLSLIKPEDLIAPVAAMGILLGLVALVAAVTGLLHPATTALIMMAVMIGLAAAAIFILAQLPNPENTIQIALALAAVIAAVGVAAALATVVGAAAVPALIGLAVMAAFIVAFTILAAIIGALVDDGSTIDKGLDVMVNVMTKLGQAIGGFVGGLLGSFSAELFSVLPQIGEAITGMMQALQPLNDIGTVDLGPVLEALGIIGGASFIGAFDGVMSTSSELTTGMTAVELVANDMEALAEGFSHYAEIMTQFEGIEIDTTALEEAIAQVDNAALVGFADGLGSIVTEIEEGQTAVELVASDMEALATGFASYAEIMTQFDGIEIDTTALESAVDEVGKASLTGFAGGLASIITEAEEGKTAVETVASDMSALASGFSDYATKMSEFDGITIDTTALDDLIDIIGEINLQGFISSIGELLLGDDDKTQVEKFGEDMGSLATALTGWQEEMSGLEGITVPTDDIIALKDALDTIKEGGILDSVLNFFGVDTSPDYTSFNEGIKGLGGAISEFANSLGDDFDEGKMTTATDAIKKLSEVGVALGDVDFGGWFHDGVLTNFAEELVDIAPNLEEFSGSFTDTEKFAQIALATKQLATGAATLANVDFGNGDLTNDDVVSNVKTNIDKMTKMIEGLAGIDTSGVDKFTSSLEKINSAKLSGAAAKIAEANSTKDSGAETGKQMSDSIAKGIDSSAIGSALSAAISSATSGIDVSGGSSVGARLGGQIAAGILKSASTIKTTVGSVAKSASNEAGKYKSEFGSAGSNMISGLANGIRNNRSAAINAAADVAAQALAAAKDRLKIASPSKAMELVGKFFDLGFSKGIAGYASRVYSESAEVASGAVDALKRSLAASNDILSGDGLDHPVITPILDLSEVQNGASKLGSLFGSSPNVLGNFTAISANAESMRQQNANEDILNALSDLGSVLGSQSGDTFIVDGVTYDDGSNITDAVRELIRAAKVERRA